MVENETYALPAFEELAKYYEHRNQDINKAVEFTLRAIKILELQNELYIHPSVENIINNFQYRLNRLNNKLNQI